MDVLISQVKKRQACSEILHGIAYFLITLIGCTISLSLAFNYHDTICNISKYNEIERVNWDRPNIQNSTDSFEYFYMIVDVIYSSNYLGKLYLEENLYLDLIRYMSDNPIGSNVLCYWEEGNQYFNLGKLNLYYQIAGWVSLGLMLLTVGLICYWVVQWVKHRRDIFINDDFLIPK